MQVWITWEYKKIIHTRLVQIGPVVSEIWPIGFRNLVHWFQKSSPVVSEIWPSHFRNLDHWFQIYGPVVSDIWCSGFRNWAQWFQIFRAVVSEIWPSGVAQFGPVVSKKIKVSTVYIICDCHIWHTVFCDCYTWHNLWLLHMT